jgi:hypothetical protein
MVAEGLTKYQQNHLPQQPMPALIDLWFEPKETLSVSSADQPKDEPHRPWLTDFKNDTTAEVHLRRLADSQDSDNFLSKFGSVEFCTEPGMFPGSTVHYGS